MTHYILQSMTSRAFIAIEHPEWTPLTLALLATVTEFEGDAWQFTTLTEAVLAVFILETEVPKLTRGLNLVPTPVSVPNPQQHFPL
jgi:hypothetical protein